MRKGVLASVAVGSFLAVISSCMISPSDQQQLVDRTKPVSFVGYSTKGGERITLQVFDADRGDWVSFQTVATSATASGKLDDADLYMWTARVYVPRSWRFWPANQGGKANFRAVTESGLALYTATSNEWGCVFSNMSSTESIVNTYVRCLNNKTKQRVTLGGAHAVSGLKGAYDNVVSANLQDWPFARNYKFANNMQGITHDNGYWYFSRVNQLARVTRTSDLNDLGTYAIIGSPFPGYNHPGDMDYSEGWLYAALEEGGGGAPNAIGAFPVVNFDRSAAHRFPVRMFPLSSLSPQMRGGSFPWIARSPESGYFYSSLFSTTDRLQRYKATYDRFGNPSGFQWCGSVKLSQQIDRVQGGAFSDSGRLYLSTDPRETAGVVQGIVKVVEMSGLELGTNLDCAHPPELYAEIIDSIYLVKKDVGKCVFGAEEVEGITVWDLDDGSAHAKLKLGHLHTLLIDCDPWSYDDLYLKHTRVTRGL